MLFGALGGGGDGRKGFDLLLAALDHLRRQIVNPHLVVFGQRAPKQPPDLGFPVHYTGHLHDDLSLQAVYSAADAFVIPSRQDNLPNTGVEAHACGTPIVAFRTGGLPDIVEHQQTGYLAEPFDTSDLATGMHWVLTKGESASLRANARSRAVERFSRDAVTKDVS